MTNNPMVDWIFRKTGGRDIRDYQLEKIKETLRFASENSAYYQKSLHGYNVGGGGITNFDDFERLPFVTADDLSAYGWQMLCVPQSDIARIVTLRTSGTTGEPKRLYFTAADQELTVDFFSVGMTCLVSETDNVAIIMPYKTPGSVGDLLGRGLHRIGCGVFPYGHIEDFKNAGEFIINNRITSLVGNPVQILKLACVSEIFALNIKLKSVLLSADYVPDAIVRRLSAMWDCKVFEHYGMTEMCFGGGVFCESLAGYHMREADLYFEIISENGESLPDGEYGEIVFTTLTRNGMPLIRYRTGDYGRFIRERCKCSTELRLMEKIRRRVNDGITIRNREFYTSDFDEMMFSNDKVADYSLEQTNKGINVQIITAEDIIAGKAHRNSQMKRSI